MNKMTNSKKEFNTMKFIRNIPISAKRMWVEAIDRHSKVNMVDEFSIGPASDHSMLNKSFGLYATDDYIPLYYIGLLALVGKTPTAIKLNQSVSYNFNDKGNLAVRLKNINNRDILSMFDLLDVNGNCGIEDDNDANTLIYEIPIELITIFKSTSIFDINGIKVITNV